MEIAKAVLMAPTTDQERGWPVVAPGPRELFPVANRPILFHQLDRLRQSGMLEATILVDRRTADPIVHAVGNGDRFGLAVRYDEVAEDGGLLAALSASRGFIGEDPVFVQHAGALLRGRLHPHVARFADDRLDALALSVQPPGGATPRRDLPPGYLLSQRALDVLLERPGAAADPLREVRACGGRVGEELVDGCLPCHGGIDALLDANRRMLEELEPSECRADVEDSVLQGPVEIHPSAIVRRTTIRGPVSIGPGVRLVDAYVGPYTSIAAAVEIEGAEVEHSIVLSGAQLRSVGTRIESSLIGQDARVARVFARPSSLRLTLGERGELLLS